MKKIFLFALLSFSINSSIVVLDMNKISNEVNNVIFPDEKQHNNFWEKHWKDDVAEWSKEGKLEIVLGTLAPYIHNETFPCLYFSPEADGTQNFLTWLKKKYGQEA